MGLQRLGLITFFLLLPGLVLAQSDDPEWYLNRPIRDIRFDGLQTVTENELSLVVEPFIGVPFTEQRFLELQRRLYALDLFEQIIPSADRIPGNDEEMILRFEVQERPVITDIEFSGNNRLGRNRLQDTILLKRGDMVTSSRLRIDEEAIRALYLEQGFPNVQVSAEFTQERDRNIVRFTIREGFQVSIESISFAGNQFATESTLRGVMQLRERNIFNRGLFQATTLETDRMRILRHYNERGFVDAEVVEIRQELREDPESNRAFLSLTIFIEEGQRFTYGGTTFSGNTIFSDEELGGLIRLEPGEVLDLTRFDVDYQRVTDRYFENGYIFNQITRREVRDEETNTISFVVDIVERNRAHIENIIFRGNEKTRTYVLEREIPLEVGDVFSATRIREGLRNLANLQYFSAIAPETPPGSAEGLMDLIINVEEGNTAEISFGVAFGGNQDFPVSAQIQWQDRNFLGRGQTFGIQATASPVSQQVVFNFLERWLFGRRWSGGLNLSFDRVVVSNIPQDVLAPIYGDGDSNRVPDPFDADQYVFTRDTEYPAGSGITFRAGDPFPGIPTQGDIATYNLRSAWDFAGGTNAAIPREYLMSYDAYNIRVGANTGYTFRTPAGRFIPRTSISTGISYITYDDTIFRPFNPTTRENLNQWRFRNTWGLGAALDNRDFIFSPTQGYRLDQQFTFTGGFLLGERHYTRSESTAEVYFTLWDFPSASNWRWLGVLAMQSRLSFLLPNFYLDDDSSRYFAVDDRDTLRLDGMFNSRGWPFRLGGASSWNNFVELRMPLAEQVIWWDFFFEAAALQNLNTGWKERDRLRDLEWSDWQFTVGTGIRFVIPQFPIRLYLGRRFRIDENGDIDWQTGNLFNRGDLDSGRGVDLIFTIGAEFF